MLVKRFVFLVLFVGFHGLFLIAHNSELPWDGIVGFKDGMKIIKNTGPPLFGENEFILEENLSISYGENEGDIFGSVTAIELDNDNNIYLLDTKRCRILSYDKKGSYRFSFGSKGNGPGEFRRPLDFFVREEKEEIYVLDDRIIHVLDGKGNYKNQIKLNHYATDFFINKEDYDFIISYLMYSKNIKEKVLGYFSPDFSKRKKIAQFFEGKIVKKYSGGKHIVFHFNHIYTPEFLFQRTFDSKCIFGHSSEYSLNVVSEKGIPLLTIEKEEDASPISSEEKRMIYERNLPYIEKKWSKEIFKEVLQFPPHRPFYKKILVDDKGRIYVGRLSSILEMGKENRIYVFDVFDKEGYYIYKIRSPIKPYVIKEGCLYSIDNRSDEEDIKIRRFKIVNWREIKEGKELTSMVVAKNKIK